MAEQLAGLFGQASPYQAFLHGQGLAQQDRQNEAAAAEGELKRLMAQEQIKAAQQTYGLNEQLNPHKVEEARLSNIGKVQDNAAKILANEKGVFDKIVRETLGEEHFVEDAKLDQYKKQFDRMSQTGDNFTNLSGMLAGTPPILRASTLLTEGKRLGLSDAQLEKLSQIPPEQMPQMLQQIGHQVIQNSPNMFREKLKKDMEFENARKLLELKNAADQALAKIKDGAGGESELKTLDAAIVRYSEAAAAATGADRQFYQEQAQYYISVKQAVAEQRSQPTVVTGTDAKGRPTYELTNPGTVSQQVKPIPSRPGQPSAAASPSGALPTVEDALKKYGVSLE